MIKNFTDFLIESESPKDIMFDGKDRTWMTNVHDVSNEQLDIMFEWLKNNLMKDEPREYKVIYNEGYVKRGVKDFAFGNYGSIKIHSERHAMKDEDRYEEGDGAPLVMGELTYTYEWNHRYPGWVGGYYEEILSDSGKWTSDGFDSLMSPDEFLLCLKSRRDVISSRGINEVIKRIEEEDPFLKRGLTKQQKQHILDTPSLHMSWATIMNDHKFSKHEEVLNDLEFQLKKWIHNHRGVLGTKRFGI